MFQFGGFFHRNKLLSVFWLLVTTSIYSYAPIINSILIDHYSISESNIAYLASVAVFGFLLANLLNSFFMNNHTNLIKVLVFSSGGLFLSLSLEVILLSQNDLNFFLFSILRSFDGFFGFLLATIIGHIFSYKIINNSKITEINGFKSSLSYLIKTVAPIVVAYFIIVPSHPESVLFLALFSSLLILVLVLIYRRYFYFKYTKILLQNTGSEKRQFKVEFKRFFSVNSVGFRARLYLLFSSSLHNIIRPCYDIILPAMLLVLYDYSVVDVSLVVGLMVLGQAFQYKIGLSLKYISIDALYLIHLIGLLSVLLFLFLVDNLEFYQVGGLFLLLGVFRSIYQIWDFGFKIQLIDKKKITLQNIVFINSLFSESFHLFGNLVVGLLVITSGVYLDISILYYAIIFILVVSHLLYLSSLSKKATAV